MEMTDLQRRWWFANHPEFSWGRKTALANERLIPIRNLTRNIQPENHGPALQVRGTQCGGEFLGATDLIPRSVLEGISIQNHFSEDQSV
jgi:hypothetical protein